ncbi:MAG TPA: mechanosensitive ion channel domain-containing protein, partial [Stellaceae bacterium]|nr:mechanosensitive ion channel domain-containing protein [Stellaceae bacterium]
VEARRLSRFLSGTIFAIILLVGFGRYGLMDEDSGAPHVIGLVNAVVVCGLYVLIVYRARAAAEALIRGRRTGGIVAAMRDALARMWVPIAVTLVGGLFVFFVAGLSLGLLAYYHAAVSTFGVLFVALVLDRLTERAWHDAEGPAIGSEHLKARTVHRILRAIGVVVAAMMLAWIWTGAIEMSDSAADAAMRSVAAAVATLFIAFVAWELVRLAIDRHLEVGSGPTLPGADSDDELAAPASRLQTILPMVRAAFGVVIGVIAALIVLSRLGVDTAPLIAGAGVFGLAVSFGSQSLVRDIISGLFYMWDDAFRVGEYIDTGRLKGTVETLGIRSVKLRHQNGPLHTIPYGQLGAVTNLSRDFATIKFNLRFEPGTDIDLVRKTIKQLGLAMQEDNSELAAEIMLPLKLQGVAEIVDSAMVLRFKFTARPIKPSWVQREYLKRMVQAFAAKDIRFATGAMVLQTLPSPGTGPVNEPGVAADVAARAAATTIAAASMVEAAGG